MTDRERVIEGLEMSYRYSNVDESNTLVPQQLVLDAIALLKAQEQEPISASIADSDGGLMHWWACGNCQAPINPEDRFCHECGRAVKWDG